MPLNANVTMTFTSYQVQDGGIVMGFVCSNPGGGEDSDYTIFFTDAEIAAIGNLAQFNAAVLTKLKRKFRAENIASRLDPMIGRSVTLP